MSGEFVNPSAVKTIFDMYLKPDFADVHFTFPNDDQNEIVPAHRSILASVSPVFAAMLFGSMKEGKEVKIEDSKASSFKKLLQFIYLPKISLSMEDFGEVVRLADKYDMLDHLESCGPYLEGKLSIKNAVFIYQLGASLKNTKLMGFSEKMMQAYTQEVLKTDAFLNCDEKVIEYILQSERLVCSEYELFDACIKWAENCCRVNGLDEKNPANLKAQLGHCFHFIQFGDLAGRDFNHILSNDVYKNMFDLCEMLDILRTRNDENFQSEIFKRVKRTGVPKGTIELIGQLFNPNVRCYVKQRESLWLSTNELTVIAEIAFGALTILGSGGHPGSYDSNVEIVEYDTKIFDRDAPSKVLCTIANCAIGADFILKLPSPVFIKPEKIYEIRTFYPSKILYYRHYAEKAYLIKFGNKITIQIHEDPTDCERARRNFITSLTLLHF